MSNSSASEAAASHAAEVAAGQRFEFGKNWAAFIGELQAQRIATAEESLKTFLEVDSLEGRSFIDVGCGSGVFSLAARRLGAKVLSFDYDPNSVACAVELRRRYFPGDDQWTVQQGSALDQDFLAKLGQFDVMYSWGVLHHTGQMWTALGNVAPLVKPGGKLFVSIYNDRGKVSRRWTVIKKTYNRLPRGLRWLVLLPSGIHYWWRPMVKDALMLRPFHTWRSYSQERGMSPWRDLVDWVGGYPFEVAKPEELFEFYKARGFTLTKMRTCGGLDGCNELVFEKRD